MPKALVTFQGMAKAKIAKILRTFIRQPWINEDKIIDKQFFQPKSLLESTIIFLASVDTNTLSLHMLHLCSKWSLHRKSVSATFQAKKKKTNKQTNKRYTISAQMVSQTNLKNKFEIQEHRLLSCGFSG